jgi:hypothetical protein
VQYPKIYLAPAHLSSASRTILAFSDARALGVRAFVIGERMIAGSFIIRRETSVPQPNTARTVANAHNVLGHLVTGVKVLFRGGYCGGPHCANFHRSRECLDGGFVAVLGRAGQAYGSIYASMVYFQPHFFSAYDRRRYDPSRVNACHSSNESCLVWMFGFIVATSSSQYVRHHP